MRHLCAIALSVSALCSPCLARAQTSWVEELGAFSKSIATSRYAWIRPVASRKAQPPTPTGRSGEPPGLSAAALPRDGQVHFSDTRRSTLRSDGTWRAYTPEEDARLDAATNTLVKEAVHAVELIKKGKVREGEALACRLIREAPWYSPLRRELADICMREGRYAESLALIAPDIQPGASEGLLVRAAYAGAMSGHVFDGQRAYTDRRLSHLEATFGCAGVVPTSPNLSGVRESASIALAYKYQENGDDQNALRYLLVARRFNPSNPWTLYSIGAIYQHSHQFERSTDMYGRAIAVATGRLREMAQVEYERVKYQRDCIIRDKAKRKGE